MDELVQQNGVWIRRGRLWKPLRFLRGGGPAALGEWGEWVALKHVRKLGWDVIARNWKGRRGEVDLIAYDALFLVFLEVKTRLTPAVFPPEDQVGPQKERRLDELACKFLWRHDLEAETVRLDVIGIETGDLRHYVLRHYLG